MTAVAMARSGSLVDHYLAEHAAYASLLPGYGVPWLDELRGQAIARFAELGLPSPREEQWKYTRVTPIERRAFRPLGEFCIGLDQDDIAPYLFEDLDGHTLVFVNGQYAPQLSRPGVAENRLRVASLAHTLAEAPDEVEPYLARYADLGANGFAALSAAFMGEGAYIHLPRDRRLERPIHLVYLSTAVEGDVFIHPRNLIVAADGSEGRVIESYVGMGEGRHLTNATTEVVLGANAAIEHIKLQHESSRAFHIAGLRVQQARSSRFTSHSLSFGGQLVRNDLCSLLDGEGAECTLNGLFVVGGRQHVDFHTTVEHARPHGTSREYYKGILDGRSHGVFNGRVHVHPGAQKTDSEQANQNLLLSRDAEVDTKPELEIYADDVKCSHGATVGQLDEEMLFYLRSRGIDASAARGLLTYGFAQDVIGRISLAPVRERLEGLLVERVPDAEHVREVL